MHIQRTTASAAGLVALYAFAGCAHRVRVAEYDGAPAAAVDTVVADVMVEVENHNWADVVLYIVHDGVQTRFAQVTAAHNISIRLPEKLQGQMGIIRLAVRRIGGTDSFISQAISLRGNSAVRFTIESDLNRSSVGVW